LALVVNTHAQPEFTHVEPPVHTWPQTPQLFESLAICASQPFVAWPSQSTKPELHALVQLPLAQVGAEFGCAVHAVPQFLQFCGSVLRFVQNWFGAVPHTLGSCAGH